VLHHAGVLGEPFPVSLQYNSIVCVELETLQIVVVLGGRGFEEAGPWPEGPWGQKPFPRALSKFRLVFRDGSSYSAAVGKLHGIAASAVRVPRVVLTHEWYELPPAARARRNACRARQPLPRVHL
jgi:hypothetical protein